MQLPIRSASIGSTAPHACRCRSQVAEVATLGVQLWSESEVVAFKLDELRTRSGSGGAESSPVTLSAAHWEADMEEFLATLSPIERSDVKAAGLGEDGTAQSWTAIPADTFLLRQKSSWLPHVLNETLIFPHYQPIVDIRANRTVAFEALMRANVDGRLVSGGELVDACRAHNALFQFDQKARTKAIRHSAGKLHDDELLFVNFTPMVIYDPKICLQSTWEAAQAVGWKMEKLVFEVIESETFPNIDHLRHILDTYREHGCGVALDDFGTGHTSLSYIEELRPNYIKLAKELLPDRPRRNDLALVRGLVDHAKNRGITTLIEGVETPEQLDAAHELGIDLVQGYLLGRPAAEPMRVSQCFKKAA
ncbi:hypothetical protein BH11PLA1_BH11PLA1_04800 [soil metagenome]